MSSDNESSSAAAAQSGMTKMFGATVHHPRLKSTDAYSIKVFLWFYNQYSRQVQERAEQLLEKDFKLDELVSFAQIMFWVHLERIESRIDLEI